MAEMLLKVANSNSGFEDGDIICGFNQKKINTVHAEHICDVKRYGFNGDGLRPNSLASFFYEKCSKYKFTRISHTHLIRKNLITNEEEVVSNEPNEKGEYIDIPLFISRKLRNQEHHIFGKSGHEFWYGDTNITQESIDLVWQEIEFATGLLKKNFSLWPLTQREKKVFLGISTDDFSDKESLFLTSPLFDEDFIASKRCFNVNWRDFLDSSTINKIDDETQQVDIRKLFTYFREEIVKAKGLGIMVNLELLKTEVTTDPLNRGYINMSDSAVANSLNSTSNGNARTIVRPITSSVLLAWAASNARMAKIEAALAKEGGYSQLPPEIRSVVLAADLMIRRGDTSLDLSLSDRQQMVAALVFGGVFSQEDATSLYALSQKSVSRAEELGFTTVFPSQVNYVRNQE